MKVTDIIKTAKQSGEPRFAIELLPPLKGEGTTQTFEAIEPLMQFGIAYVNVTFHREDLHDIVRADGHIDRRVVRRRPGTVGISGAIMRRFGIPVVPHMICGGQSRYDIEDALIDLDLLGINNVLALRGDNQREQKSFVPHSGGHSHAAQLVAQITNMNKGVFVDNEVDKFYNSRFCVGVAGYPEKHYEAASIEQDIANLRAKVDAGADYIVTQMSFDNSKILSFIDKCRAAGITVPIVPGIKPLSTKAQLVKLPEIFEVELPADLVRAASACKDNAQVREVGIEWAINQGRELIKAGVPVLHFYSMGKTDNVVKIARALF